jgi:hypothetical protein
MRHLLSILVFLITLTSFSQVKVVKISTQRISNRLIGYHLTLKNKSNKFIDSVEWTATFVNKFGDVKDEQNESWSSGNSLTIDTSKEVKPNGNLQVTIKCGLFGIKDATDVNIKINRIHYKK